MTFSHLASCFTKLEETPSRNTMTALLAELFRESGEDEIAPLCYLLQGRVAPLYEAIEFGVAEKFMIRAITLAYGVREGKVQQEFKKVGDLGIAAQQCYLVLKHNNENPLHVQTIYDRLRAIASVSGEGSQEKKIGLLADLLRSVDEISARYIVRITLDKLRLGFSDMTILDALSWMAVGDKSYRLRLEEAYNVRPDIGYIAKTLKSKGVDGLRHVKAVVGAPILAALCQRVPTADEMIQKMGEVGVEPKYDGVRVQIHYQITNRKSQAPNVWTFSRNLENTTAMFPELRRVGIQIDAREVILDCEAVGIDPKTNKIVPFQETMTRKRKHHIEEAKTTTPLRFYVFDILYKDGDDLLSYPLSLRRKILEQTIQKGTLLVLSPQIVTDSPSELRKYHDEQLRKGLEGVVVKKWISAYEPGRRGYHWVKFKEEEGKTGKLTDTIDAVIMGYSKGQGKRSGFGIGMFLVGVRKSDTFVTISKIGTGVSDELWKDLYRKLEQIKSPIKPKEYGDVNKLFVPDVWVKPEIVVEVAGDDLTKSPSHGAGIAVRFPRLVRIRTDKSPLQTTTVSEVSTMYANQKHMK